MYRPGLPLEFLQNKEPKLLTKDLMPVSWPKDPDLEWCPPGHGDLYTALRGTGLLQQLLDGGYRYVFVSNSDNLGAVPDARVAGWFAASGAPFAIEAVRRTPSDRKGGHFARRKVDGRLVLRETAQTLDADKEALADLSRHRYCSTNNLWIDLQALHRVRDRMIAHRTRLISQMRAFCLEYGIAIHQGAGKFKAEIPRVLADETNELTPSMRRILTEVHGEMMELEQRIVAMNHEIEDIAARSDTARRLMTVPGIGPLASTALLAAAGSGRQFAKARDLAAWLGLVPREHSTGGKTKLLGISKRGNKYLRRMIVHGARSCVTHLDRSRDRLGPWLDGLESRMHKNKVTVALAAKIARIVWVILTKPGATYERRVPAFG